MRPIIATIFLCILAAIILLVWGSVLNPPQKQSGQETQPTSYLPGRQAGEPPANAPSITFIDPVRGPRNARVKIVEYADFACAACRAVMPTLAAVLAAHPNEVALVFKYAPDAALHAEADRVAEAAACAHREGKFWALHDALFAGDGGPTLEEAIAKGIEVGLGTDFRACVEKRETKPVVDRSLEEARWLGIASTPYFFVGDERIDGAPSRDELEAAVGRALQKP